MAGPVNNPDVKAPESPRSLVSPCERLWARYHSDPEGDKVEILAELIGFGILKVST